MPRPVEHLPGSAEVADDRLAAGWRLSAMGLRRGEFLGLRWQSVDIDSDRPSLTVDQARVLAGNGGIDVGPPKTERSRRRLPLDPQTVAQLRGLRAWQREESLACGRPGLPEYVVSDEVGRPVRPERWSDEFKRHATDAGLPALHLHGLRHSALSAMHERGATIATISRWAGHSSAAFTMSVYVVASDDSLIEGGAILARALSGGL